MWSVDENAVVQEERRRGMKDVLSILIGLVLGFLLITYMRVLHIEKTVTQIAEKMEVAK